MSLTKYHQKRHFNRTPEPRGKVKAAPTKSALRFAIQKHDASRLHYDFRLELDGVLKSWAVPKGPSFDPSRKALAVQVEDHPIDYGDFEGIIPEGEYGGGTVLLWDTGTWECLHDPHEGMATGRMHFVLHGQKLVGEWSLVQMHGKAGDEGKNWLLMKVKDKFATAKGDITADAPDSVKTGRTLDQIASASDKVWTRDGEVSSPVTPRGKDPWPGYFPPQLAVLSTAPPAGDQWVHEIKYDGYRILAHIRANSVELYSRNGKIWTHRFSAVAEALKKLKVDSAILDGEMVVLDKEGRSDFQALQAVLKDKVTAEPIYYVFDLLYHDGNDLREQPLVERKNRLEQLLAVANLAPRVNYSEHLQTAGQAMVDKACDMGLEGIVSKFANGHYLSRRDPTWLKSKCVQRQEFVIIGYTDPQGARQAFGSLLLGYHDEDKKLVYAGRVGTGFNDKLLNDMLAQFKKIEQDEPPSASPPPPRERRNAHWLKPTLVGEVKFTGWTRDGSLRHPSFVALRSDKPASKIVREIPIQPEKAEKKIKAVPLPRNPKPAKAEPTAKSRTASQPLGSPSSNLPVEIEITHPDKIFYPDSKTTKQNIIDYYRVARQWMLPLVTGRPLSLRRCPQGIAAKCFFQRNWTSNLSSQIAKVDVGEGKTEEFHITVNDFPGIVALAQMGVLEIHTWNCRNDDVDNPDQIIFDLDPGPGVDWKMIVAGARIVRKALTDLKLPTFLKTSGGKGLHITVPIVPNLDWDTAKSFSKTIAESLAAGSDRFVANMRKDLRGGKIYLDFNRNGRTATAVAPYSTRARENAPVAMPISWEELGKLSSADQFTVETAGRYLAKRKADPWQDFEASRVDLHTALSESAPA